MTASARQPDPSASAELLTKVERALAAFDPDDGPDRLSRLLTGLLSYADIVDHPAMLLARAVQRHAVDSITGQLGCRPDDVEVPPEQVDAAAFTEAAGRVIGALWYLAVHMPETDPMLLQASAHQVLRDLLDDEHR